MPQKEFDLLQAHRPEKGTNLNRNSQIFNTLHEKVTLNIYFACLDRLLQRMIKRNRNRMRNREQKKVIKRQKSDRGSQQKVQGAVFTSSL